MDGYPVGDVARLAHVSVRTLHHYDAIGLLSPGERTAAGYRCYTTGDLRRLQQVLFYRELGFGLDDIAAILADPGATAEDHLRHQHHLLRERILRNQAMVEAIEKEMEARHMGISLTPEEQFEIFGSDKYSGDYAQEAERRWGETQAWKQSQRRTSAYTKQDWIEIKAEQDANQQAFAAALAAGIPAYDPRARWTSPRRTGTPSAHGSTSAAMRCTSAWPRCTSPTSDSARPTRQSRPGSRSTSTTPSSPMPGAPGDLGDGTARGAT